MDVLKFQSLFALLVATASVVYCKSVVAKPNPETLFKEFFAKLPETLRTGIQGDFFYPPADPTHNQYDTYDFMHDDPHIYLNLVFHNYSLVGCSQFNVSQFNIYNNATSGRIGVDFVTATSVPVVMSTDYEAELAFGDGNYVFNGRMNFTSSSYRSNVTYEVGFNEAQSKYYIRDVLASDMTFEDLKLEFDYETRPVPNEVIVTFEWLLRGDIRKKLEENAYTAFQRDERGISQILFDQIQN